MVGIITIHVGRCYCLIYQTHFVADVIALADVIAMFLCVVSFIEADVFYLIIECISCINKYKQS